MEGTSFKLQATTRAYAVPTECPRPASISVGVRDERWLCVWVIGSFLVGPVRAADSSPCEHGLQRRLAGMKKPRERGCRGFFAIGDDV